MQCKRIIDTIQYIHTYKHLSSNAIDQFDFANKLNSFDLLIFHLRRFFLNTQN